MRNYLQTNISTIFIMLGHECNMNCKYCLQHDVVNVALGKDINPDIYNFINDIARNQNENLGLQFYGGEPLVFFEKIQEFINGLKEHNMPNNVYFTMITNGKLLDEEKVEYLNKNFSHVTISWDGRNSEITRGYDVVKENKENIFKLNNFSFSGVLSAYNYILDYLEDCEEVNRDYVENYHGHTLYFNVDELLDVNMQNQDLKQFDYDKVQEQMTQLCEEYRLHFQENKPISVIRKKFIEEKIGYIRNAINQKSFAPNRDRCGNGCEVLNMDLQGNLYKCHNTDTKIGYIRDNYFDIMKNVFDLDKTKDTSKKCNECLVQIICRNGCPLVNDKARGEYYCKMSYQMNYPIMQLIKILGGAVYE